MSFVLPKEAQTRKLNSLPDDLRKLADELISKKFDTGEVVERPKRRKTPFETYTQRPAEYDVPRRWAGFAIDRPDTQSIMYARKSLLNAYGVGHKYRLVLRIGMQWVNYMKQLQEFTWSHDPQYNDVAYRIYDVEVKIDEEFLWMQGCSTGAFMSIES